MAGAGAVRGRQKKRTMGHGSLRYNLAPRSGTDPEFFCPSKSRLESIAARSDAPVRSGTTSRGKSCRQLVRTSRGQQPTPYASPESGSVRWKNVASRVRIWPGGSASRGPGFRRSLAFWTWRRTCWSCWNSNLDGTWCRSGHCGSSGACPPRRSASRWQGGLLQVQVRRSRAHGSTFFPFPVRVAGPGHRC